MTGAKLDMEPSRKDMTPFSKHRRTLSALIKRNSGHKVKLDGWVVSAVQTCTVC